MLQKDALEYVGEILIELGQIAAGAGALELAYIIGIAHAETKIVLALSSSRKRQWGAPAAVALAQNGAHP